MQLVSTTCRCFLIVRMPGSHEIRDKRSCIHYLPRRVREKCQSHRCHQCHQHHIWCHRHLCHAWSMSLPSTPWTSMPSPSKPSTQWCMNPTLKDESQNSLGMSFMCVCARARMYTCIYIPKALPLVSLYVCIYVSMYVLCMYICMYICIYVWNNDCMYVCMYVCTMYVYMYVCMK